MNQDLRKRESSSRGKYRTRALGVWVGASRERVVRVGELRTQIVEYRLCTRGASVQNIVSE